MGGGSNLEISFQAYFHIAVEMFRVDVAEFTIIEVSWVSLKNFGNYQNLWKKFSRKIVLHRSLCQFDPLLLFRVCPLLECPK